MDEVSMDNDKVVVNVTLPRILVQELDHATADTPKRRSAVMAELLRFGLDNKEQALRDSYPQ